MHAHPGLDERPRQPGPDGALVIGAVTLRRPAAVMRRIILFARRERTRAHRRPQLILHHLHHARGPFALDQGQRQTAHGKELVRAHPVIDPARLMIDIDDVIEAAARLVPETLAGKKRIPARRARAMRDRAGWSGRARSATAPAPRPACRCAASRPSRPTLASIQVSCTPGTPQASSPSESPRMPYRVPCR